MLVEFAGRLSVLRFHLGRGITSHEPPCSSAIKCAHRGRSEVLDAIAACGNKSVEHHRDLLNDIDDKFNVNQGCMSEEAVVPVKLLAHG